MQNYEPTTSTSRQTQELLMKYSKRVAIGATVIASSIAASLIVALPASASTVDSAPSPDVSSVELDALFAGVSPDTHVFDARVAIAAGARRANVLDFADGYAAGGGAVRNAAPDPEVVERLRAIDLAGCSGRNSFDITGAQANLYLNSCVANDLSGKLAQGAGLAALIALITSATGAGPAVAGIVAGLLTIGSGAVVSCNARGRGIVGHNIPATAITWCNSQ
jgi:hypothetical protein